MDLKFSFGGASPDHSHPAPGHGDAPSGSLLPISSTGGSGGSDFTLAVRLDSAAVVAEVVTDHGVSYARVELELEDDDSTPAAVARTARSAMARAVAQLEGPLADSLRTVSLELHDAAHPAHTVLSELGIDPEAPAVTATLQRRIGVSEGVPISLS